MKSIDWKAVSSNKALSQQISLDLYSRFSCLSSPLGFAPFSGLLFSLAYTMILMRLRVSFFAFSLIRVYMFLVFRFKILSNCQIMHQLFYLHVFSICLSIFHLYLSKDDYLVVWSIHLDLRIYFLPCICRF